MSNFTKVIELKFVVLEIVDKNALLDSVIINS
jgi:hypothetical protein